ncbi:hypothetical protein, partial [Actinomadura geliboluensis]
APAGVFFYLVFWGVGAWGAPPRTNHVRSLHRFGSPGGSLRDQVLASLEPAFGRDRDGPGGRVAEATG